MKRLFTPAVAGVAALTLAGASLTAMLPAGAATPDATDSTAPALSAGGIVPAHIQSDPGIDPAMRRLFMTLAVSVLSSFATSAARGSMEAFDPGPAIEAALKGALDNREVDTVIDRLVALADSGPETSGASPEMRSMLKGALGGVIAMARNEIRRELSVGGVSGVPATP